MANEKFNNKRASGNNKGVNRGRGRNAKKGGKNPRSMGVRDGYSKDHDGDLNDASYYFADAGMMKQLTDISFNQYMGMPFSVGSLDHRNIPITKPVDIPSMMRIMLAPSAGTMNLDTLHGANNGINMAAKQLFMKLSAGNMKSTEYGPEDIALALLAIGNVLETQSYIRRFFGIARLYNQRNREVPHNLLTGMGIEVDDFIHNINDYRSRFNYILMLANKIPFPGNFPYFRKCAEIYDHVYVDRPDSAMAQLIYFVPYCLWEFTDDYDENGSGLTTLYWLQSSGENFDTPRMTMEFILDAFEAMVLKLVNSTALTKVYSDILRLIDKGELVPMSFAQLPVDYSVIPVYSEEVMSMIANASIIGSPLQKSVLDELNDDTVWMEDHHPTLRNDVKCLAGGGQVCYYPAFQAPSLNKTLPDNAIINFTSENVSTEQLVEATRFTAFAKDWHTFEDPSVGFKATTHVVLGDHYIVNLSIDYLGRNGQKVATYNSSVQSYTSSGIADILVPFEYFKRHPFLYLQAVDFDTSGNPITEQVFIFGDTDWFTTIDARYLSRVNDFAMLGLFTLR